MKITSQEGKVLTFLVTGFRHKILLLWFSVLSLSGCIVYMAHEVSGPSLPAPPEPPKPSGTLLKSQFRIGISPDYPPLAYKAIGGLVGVEVDFANQLGKGLGKEIVFVETPFSELIQALLDERVDIIMSGMSITGERAELVAFTDSYARIGQMALVRAKDKPTFPNVQDFSNTTGKIGFVQNTTGALAAKIFSRATIVPQSTIEQGIEALRKREIDVFIHDAPTIWRVSGDPSEQELAGLYWPLTKENLAWAVRKDDGPLHFALNRELSKWQASGSLKQTLARWVTLRIW